MSGLEAAGLILGAISVLVEVIKKYDEARKYMRNYRNRAEYLRRLLISLEEHSFIIKCDLIKILRAADVEDVPFEDFKAGDFFTFLKNDYVENSIEDYLGPEGSRLYMSRLDCCQAVIITIASSFSELLPPSLYAGPRNSAEYLRSLVNANIDGAKFSWRFGARDLKFSLKKEGFEKRIQELADSARMLQALRKSRGDDVVMDTSAAPPHVMARLAIFFSKVQVCATSLYSAVVKTFPPTCQNHEQHTVRLFLDERAEILGRRGFRRMIEFQLDTVSLGPQGVDLWHRSQVGLLEEHKDHVNTDTVGFNVPAASATTSLSGSVSFASGISGSATVPGTTTTMTVARPTSPAALPQLPPQFEEIHHLCQCMNMAREERCQIGFQLSECGRLCMIRNPRAMRMQASQAMTSDTAQFEHKTLRELIKWCTTSGRPERRWSLPQQMRLAFKLACTVLQLNRTHWLEDARCRADDIHFESFRSERGGRQLSEADRPFISLSKLQNQPQDQTSASAANHLTLDLGVLLVEIQQKKSLQTWVAGGLQKYDLDVYAERRHCLKAWFENEAHFDMPLRYRAAVEGCLEMSDNHRLTWDQPYFQQRFVERVVKPLWENSNGLG